MTNTTKQTELYQDAVMAENRDLRAEVERLTDLASYAIAILSNVDGGDFKQTEEWVGAFKKWQGLFVATDD